MGRQERGSALTEPCLHPGCDPYKPATFSIILRTKYGKWSSRPHLRCTEHVGATLEALEKWREGAPFVVLPVTE